jgi:hypothetical protein
VLRDREKDPQARLRRGDQGPRRAGLLAGALHVFDDERRELLRVGEAREDVEYA